MRSTLIKDSTEHSTDLVKLLKVEHEISKCCRANFLEIFIYLLKQQFRKKYSWVWSLSSNIIFKKGAIIKLKLAIVYYQFRLSERE